MWLCERDRTQLDITQHPMDHLEPDVIVLEDAGEHSLAIPATGSSFPLGARWKATMNDRYRDKPIHVVPLSREESGGWSSQYDLVPPVYRPFRRALAV